VPAGSRLHGGWYLLALAEELTGEVTPVELGDRALMVIRDGERLRVLDARCPHRGAHLGYGGRLAPGRAGASVICPFHGKRIGLGAGTARLCVTEYQSIVAGDALFVRLGTDPAEDRGFEQAIKEIVAEKQIVGALVRLIRVPPAYVIENAFDYSHFTAVHGVDRVTGFGLREDSSGGIAVEGDFWTAVPPTVVQQTVAQQTMAQQTAAPQTVAQQTVAQQAAVPRAAALADRGLRSRFYARAVSPSLVLTELGPPEISHTLITSASPIGARSARGSAGSAGSVGSGTAADGCVIRVALGVRPAAVSAVPMLVSSVRRNIDQDAVIWDHLDPAAPARYDRADLPALAFRQFCAGFGPLA
jgi:3-ketosteroid 9alpha-monooxygenase subunit A